MTTDMTSDRPRRAKRPTKEIITDDAPRTVRTREVQSEIPGFEQEKIRAIESAADKYVEKRDLRMGLMREEIAEKDKLTALMHANLDKLDHQDGVIAYTRGDYRIIVSTTEKLKVKIGEDEDGETDGEQE